MSPFDNEGCSCHIKTPRNPAVGGRTKILRRLLVAGDRLVSREWRVHYRRRFGISRPDAASLHGCHTTALRERRPCPAWGRPSSSHDFVPSASLTINIFSHGSLRTIHTCFQFPSATGLTATIPCFSVYPNSSVCAVCRPVWTNPERPCP